MSEKDEFSTYFRAIQVSFARVYSRILTEADLTLPQYALLSQLTVSGSMSMTEVSEKLHITKPAVTHLVDCLERKAFLKRIPHPSDRRIFLLEIQQKGKKIAREIQSEILHLLLKNLNQFTPEEKKTIVRFYALLSENLEELLIQKAGSSS